MSFREELNKIVDNNDVSSLQLLLHKNPITDPETVKPYIFAIHSVSSNNYHLGIKKEVYDALLEHIRQWDSERGTFIYKVYTGSLHEAFEVFLQRWRSDER